MDLRHFLVTFWYGAERLLSNNKNVGSPTTFITDPFRLNPGFKMYHSMFLKLYADRSSVFIFKQMNLFSTEHWRTLFQ